MQPHTTNRVARRSWILGDASHFARDTLGFLAAVAAERGPIARFRVGARRFVLLSAPADVEDVLIRRREAFRKGRTLRVDGKLFLGRALSTAEGEDWEVQRTLVAHALGRARMAHHLAVAERIAFDVQAGFIDGEVRDIEHTAKNLLVRIGCMSFVGIDPAQTADEIAAAIGLALDGFAARVRVPVPTPDWLPVGHNRAMREGTGFVRAFVERAMIEKKATPLEGDDLLSALLRARSETGQARLSDEVVRDEIAVMFALGGHQMALALIWCLVSLARDPSLQGRAASQPPYVRAVVQATLRLFPPFYVLAREPIDDVEISGTTIRRRETVMLSPWVTHRSDAVFPQASTFLPERWLDLPPPLRGAYFPFGGGPRVCIAAGYALPMLTATLGVLIREWSFTLAADCDPRPRPAIALGFRRSPKMMVRRRR